LLIIASNRELKVDGRSILLLRIADLEHGGPMFNERALFCTRRKYCALKRGSTRGYRLLSKSIFSRNDWQTPTGEFFNAGAFKSSQSFIKRSGYWKLLR